LQYDVWFHLRASDVGYLQNCVIDGTIQIKLILNNYGLISLFRLVVNLQSLSQSVKSIPSFVSPSGPVLRSAAIVSLGLFRCIGFICSLVGRAVCSDINPKALIDTFVTLMCQPVKTAARQM
jgi:hypothetical protein